MKKRNKIILWAVSLIAAAAIVFGCGAWYVGDYYRTDNAAVEAFAEKFEVTVDKTKEGIIVAAPENAQAGLIFYPGGKVEFSAYEPLMIACAEKGVLCVLVEMPFNLAVLDVNAAEGIREQFPEVKSWYIGGHSLGGSMAASYISNSQESFEGLVLLGSYSTADLSQSSLKVLSLYGSEDKVMNSEKYEKYKINLPKSLTEFVIEGGCHAYFGMYGAQEGDGTPSISNEEQIAITAEKIAELIFG